MRNCCLIATLILFCLLVLLLIQFYSLFYILGGEKEGKKRSILGPKRRKDLNLFLLFTYFLCSISRIQDACSFSFDYLCSFCYKLYYILYVFIIITILHRTSFDFYFHFNQKNSCLATHQGMDSKKWIIMMMTPSVDFWLP